MIVHDPAAHHAPTPSQLEAWDASRRQDITNQLARLEQRKAEDRATVTKATSAQAQDAILEATIQQQKKRTEREARRRQLAEEAAATADAAGAIGGSEQERHGDDVPATATATTSNAIYTISVPTASDTFAWYDPKYDDLPVPDDDDGDQGNDSPARRTCTYETLDAAREAHVWGYPSNAEERARCEVFRDLWEKGYYMGGGSKFGGDWLVYPGAHFFFLCCSCHFTVSSYTCVYMHVRSDHRRSAALSFALCCHCTNLSVCPVAPDGNSGTWSTWYSNEEGASFVWVGP